MLLTSCGGGDLAYCFVFGHFSRSLYIVYIKAISSFVVIICFELELFFFFFMLCGRHESSFF